MSYESSHQHKLNNIVQQRDYIQETFGGGHSQSVSFAGLSSLTEDVTKLCCDPGIRKCDKDWPGNMSRAEKVEQILLNSLTFSVFTSYQIPDSYQCAAGISQ